MLGHPKYPVVRVRHELLARLRLFVEATDGDLLAELQRVSTQRHKAHFIGFAGDSESLFQDVLTRRRAFDLNLKGVEPSTECECSLPNIWH